MTVADRLWDSTVDVAEACLAHPFVRGLRDGSLPAEAYARFIGQDAFFLDAFARAYASGVVRAPDRASQRAFHALQHGVFDEQRLHEAAARELGIDLDTIAPLPATRAYTDFLLGTALTRTLGELLAAMAPCMRLYGWLGRRLAAEPGPGAYADWIATYDAADYHALVAEIDQLLNRFASGDAAEAERYRTAMELERRFFDMAWEATAWEAR